MIRPTDEHEAVLCVEIVADRPEWIEDLPPAPADWQLTMSFTGADLAARDRASVAELGYRPAGTAAVAAAGGAVHLLVPVRAIEHHERWWRAVLDAARRVLDLRFGPVQHALHAVIEAHTAAAGARQLRPAPVPTQRPPNA